MSKYKVWQKVRVKQSNQGSDIVDHIHFTYSMEQYRGNIYTVKEILFRNTHDKCVYRLTDGDGNKGIEHYLFAEEMLEPVVNISITSNDILNFVAGE